MSNYSEKFEKMRIAGKLASNTLDMITDYIKPGISTEKIDNLCFEYIRDNGGYSAPLFYRGFKKSGVNFLAYRCSLSSNEIKIEKKIKILND